VGKATDLRSRVRSYFSGDGRRKVDGLLRELAAIDHIVCANPLEAAVLEVRLIHHHLPRFNRQSKSWRRYAYLKVTLDERFPRLSVVRTVRQGDGGLYLGPLPSVAAAREVADAIQSAAPIRRCNRRPTRTPTGSPCAPAQLGVATCPCSGSIDEASYGAIVARVVDGLTGDPSVLLDPLQDRMHAMAAAERFEEAAAARDRADVLARALQRQRRMERIRHSGRVIVEVPGEGGAMLVDGRLVDAWAEGGGPAMIESLPLTEPPPNGPVTREAADELSCVASWLEDRAARLRLLSCDGNLATPLPRLPSFQPSAPSLRV
jgi:DNA polymerase-3 subunit epsilon